MPLLNRLARWYRAWARGRSQAAGPVTLRPTMEAMEPRILYSADPIGASLGLADAAEVRVHEDPNAPQVQRQEWAFVDARVQGLDRWLESWLSEGTAQGVLRHVVTLDDQADGLAQIDAALAGQDGIGALHLIGHAEAGRLLLGRDVIDAQVLDANAAMVQRWGPSLTPDADILVYGCDVAATQQGQAMLQVMARLSGADVAASTDATGAASLGGDWDLEYRTGSIEAAGLMSAQAQAQWQGLLAMAPIGGEVRVNTTTTNSQATTEFGGGNVAMDASGNYIVVWVSLQNDTGDVYFQRYAADGTPVGSNTLAMSYTTNQQYQPAVSYTANGGFVIVGTSSGQDGSGLGVYARVFDANGTPLANEFRVNTSTSGDQEIAKVAAAPDGSFVIAFSDFSGGVTDVLAQRYTATGTPVGSNWTVNTTTNNVQAYPDVAVGLDGRFIITWESTNQDGSLTGVYGQRYNADGTAAGGEFRINVNTANAQESSKVSYASDGSFVVAWESAHGSSFDMIARRYAADGTALTGEILVNSWTLDVQRWGDVVSAPDGSFIVTWQSNLQDGSGLGVYAQQFDASGSRVGGEFRVNTTTTNDQTDPSIAWVGSQAVVVWSGEGTGDTSGVFLRRLGSTGITVTPTGGLVTTEAGGTAQFSVVLDAAPTANVTIPVSVSATTEGSVSTALLTFTTANWNVAQTVTVTGVDDTLDDGDKAYSVVLGAATSTDGNYSGVNPADVTLTNQDNDSFNKVVVTTTADTVASNDGDTSSLSALLANKGSDGQISLREAIIATNNTVNGSGGNDRIEFAIAGAGPYTFNIGAGGQGALPTITDAVTIDGTTEDYFATNGNNPVIVLNGGGTVTSGLFLAAGASGSSIRGLVVQNFSSYGIKVQDATDVTIAGNFVGTNAAATAAAGNGVGIDLWNAQRAVIGGVTAADRNIISGNTNIGLNIVGANTGSPDLALRVQGNYIGTTLNGLGDLGNAWHGIYVNNASGVTIGGTAAGAGNLISGNGTAAGANGITLQANAQYNTIQGNVIGLTAAGNAVMTNTGVGVKISGGYNTLGGTTAAARNVISGNSTMGVQITGASAVYNTVAGNYIGTSTSGTLDMGNSEDGIQIDTGASYNTIGGTASGARNIIAGNNNAGIAIDDVASTGNQVLGNWIGVGSDGSTQLANLHNGINVNGATGTVIGNGSASGRNVVTSSGQSGIGLTNASGTLIKGNWLVNNSWDGITLIGGSTTGNVIGDTSISGGNLIAYNTSDGITLWNSVTASDAATILANNTYGNGARGIDLNDNGYDTNDSGDGDTGANGTQNYPVLTSAVATTDGTTFTGSLNSTANATFRIDFYANRPGDVDGTHGEGARWLGSTYVTTNGSGNATINALLASAFVNTGDRVTATATRDLGSGTYGGTSEFATNITASATGVVVVDTMSDTQDGIVTSITNLGNNRGGDGKISLREAMAAVNATANGASPDRIVFAIPPNVESANYNTAILSPSITLGSALTTMTQPVVIDASTQPGFAGSPLVQLRGNGTVASGITLAAGSTGSTVRGLVIGNFTTAGINITGGNTHTIAGNWIGLGTDGATADANARGIILSNSTGTVIGGTDAADRNVISASTSGNLYLNGAVNSVIYGNYIGTDATGTQDPDGNTYAGGRSGIYIDSGSTGNQIGNTIAGARNLISGNNWMGVDIIAATATGNTISGNYIGTTATGLAALANSGGVGLWSAGTGNRVVANVIAGNAAEGVTIGAASNGVMVQGNYIGVGADGSTVVGAQTRGVEVYGGAVNTVIGTNADGSNDAAERNVISGNGYGVYVTDAGTTGTQIKGNYIGTDASGTLARGNTLDGIAIGWGSSQVTVGGLTAVERNVISGNATEGIWIDAPSVTVQGNYIGLNAAGTAALGNGGYGVDIFGSGTGATVGGAASGAGNVISGNVSAGLRFQSGSSGSVKGNRFGTDAAGSATISSGGAAIQVATSNVQIGGITSAEANTITGAGTHGIIVTGSVSGNAILRNAIYGNAGLGIELGNDGVTANDTGDADAGANNLQNFPVLIAARTEAGSQLVVSGTLNSNASSFYRIEFFSNTAADPSGNGEGQTYLGFVNVATDGSGNAGFNTTLTANVPVGSVISATATRATDNTYTSFTQTSEFAGNVAAVNAAPKDIRFVPGVADAALLGFYAFSDASSLGRDDAGDDAPITLSGSPTQTIGPDASGALNLDGGSSGQYGDIAGLQTGGAMTIAGWVRFDSTGSYGWERVVDFGEAFSGGIGSIYVGRLGTSNTLTFNIELSGPVAHRVNASNVIVNGSWMHFAATVDATGQMSLYINGALANTATGIVPTVGVRPNNYIGKSNWAADDAFDGAIDNLVITSGAMSAPQVAALYAQTNTWTLPENSSNGTVLGTLVGLDPDASQTVTYSLSDSAGGRFAIDPNTGTLTVANGSLLDYETASSHGITAVATNGLGMSYSESFTILLTDANDAPVVTTSGSVLAYAENQTATAVDGALVVSDLDSTQLTGATVNLSAGFAAGQDELGFTDQSGITGVWNAGTGTLVLSGTASVAQYQAALRSITYRNLSDDPSTASRTVSFAVSDGVLTSATATRGISVTAVNDVPVSTAPTSLTLLEDGSLQLTGLSIADPDAGSSTLRVELAVGQGTLVASSGSGVTVSGSGTTLLVLNGTLTDLNSWLASGSAPTYQPVANASGNVTLTMQTSDGLNTGTGGVIDSGRMDYRFQDGGWVGPDAVPQTGGIIGVTTGGSQASSIALALSGSNTTFGLIYTAALDITTAGSYTFDLVADDRARFVIDGTPLSLAAFGAISDTVSLSAGRHSIEIRYTQGTGGLALGHTISGPDTGGTAQNIFAFSGMGRLVSPTASTTLTVTPVNDAPAGADATITLNEDNTYTFTAANFGFTDTDGNSLSRVWFDTLPANGSLRWNGSRFAAGNWVSAADIAAGLLTYLPQPDAAGTGLASFTFRVQDNGGTANGGADTDPTPNTITLNVTAINDAPVLVRAGGNLLTDGSFEAGTAGWSSNGSIERSALPGNYGLTAAADGSYLVEVESNPTTGPTYIEQTVATEIGRSYFVSLQVASRANGTADMGSISLNGVEVDRFTATADWTTVALSFTATSTSTTLRITSLGSQTGFVEPDDGNGLMLDDVRLGLTDTTVSLTEGGAAVGLVPAFAVVDVEQSAANNFNGASLTLARSGGANADDVFSATGTLGALTQGGALVVGGTTIGTVTTNSGGQLVLSFGAGATNTLVNQAVQQIAYAYAGNNPPPSVSIVLSFNDGNGGSQGTGGPLSASGLAAVTIAAMNDAPVFGTGGGATQFDLAGGYDEVKATLVQADGRVVLAGLGTVSGVPVALLTRLLPNGTLDTGFGSGGHAVISFGSGTDVMFYGVAQQSDGKIVASGWTDHGGNHDLLLVRLNADGTPDSSFGTGGRVVLDLGGTDEYGDAVAIQNDGKIVVSGSAGTGNALDQLLLRFNADGSLDAGFGSGGVVVTAIGSGRDIAYGLAIQADGRIVTGGYGQIGSTVDATVARYLSNGTLDASFGTGGIVTVDVSGNDDFAQVLRLQTDGKIVLAGSSSGVQSQAFVLRLLSDGSLDAGFGSGGVAQLVSATDETAWDVALQADGSLLVVGGRSNGARTDVLVARLQPDGNLDTSYGNTGRASTSLGSSAYAQGAAIQADGRLVVAGGTGGDLLAMRLDASGLADLTFGASQALTGSVGYTENGAPVALGADLTVFDAELSGADNFSGATLTLARQGGANAQDQLLFDGVTVTTSGANVLVAGVQVGSYSFTGGQLVVSFGASATQARVNTLLQNILYENTSDTPPTSVQIDWTFGDGNAGAQGSGGALAAVGSVTVTLTPTNDAPQLAGGSNLAYVENQPAAAIDSSLTLADPDSATLASATVQISGHYRNAEDVLAFANVGMGNITGSWDAGTGTLTLTSAGATATLAQWQAALRAVTYANTADDPDTNPRTVSFTVNDGSLASNTVTRTVTLTAVNDAPTDLDLVAPGAVNLLVNGGFENSAIAPGSKGNPATLPGWTVLGGELVEVWNGLYVDGPPAAAEGTSLLELDSGSAVNGIAQSVTTVAGQTYVLSFDLSNRVGVATSTLEVFWRGARVANIERVDVAWQTFQLIVTGSGGSDELRLVETAPENDTFGVLLDNVQLVAARTPAPSVAEGSASGTVVAQAVGNDPDGVGLAGTVYSLTDSAGGAFAIDALTGVITVADGSLLDHETAASRSVTVRVTDNASQWREEVFAIAISDVNEAPTAVQPTRYLSDLTPQAQAIYALWLDVDHGGHPLNLDGVAYAKGLGTHPGPTGYGLGWVDYAVDGATAFKATIGVNDYQPGPYGSVRMYVYLDGVLAYSSGVLTSDSAPIDLDIDTSGVSTLRLAVDNAGIGNTFDHAIWAQARLEGGAVGFNAVPELAANGTIVGSVVGLDPDEHQAWTYSLTDNAGGRFAIDANTGRLTVANGALLNYEAAPSYSVTVRATDPGGLWVDQSMIVATSNANDAPVLTPGAPVLNAITEDQLNSSGQTVGSFLGSSISDQDAGAVQGIAIYAANGGSGTWQYSIDGGNQWNALGSVSTTAALLLRSGDLLRLVPDGQNGTTGSLSYFAWDQTSGAAGGLADATQRGGTSAFSAGTGDTATITVTPVNDAPVISSDGGGATAALNVAENSTAVTTVTRTDVDGGTPVYSIVGGADAAKFTIGAASGVLSFVAAPDYELPGDVGANNVYDVRVQVSDGAGGIDTQDIAVTVTPVNEFAPQITSNGGGATATLSLVENSVSVTTVTATDADLPAPTLQFSIVGGADGGLFTVNGASGALRFAAAPDFENPADVGADNVYEVLVRASDGAGLLDEQLISVTVTDGNEAPTATITPAGYVATEQVSLLLSGTGLSVADPDAGALPIRATLTVTAGQLSAVSGSTGVLVTGSDTAVLTLEGTVAQLNSLFAGAGGAELRFLSPSDNAPATAMLDMLVEDLGHSGAGGPLSASDSAVISIAAVNDAPTVSVPPRAGLIPGQTLVFDSQLLLGIALADPDAGASLLTLNVSVSHGALTLSGTAGLSFSVGTGTNDTAMTITGTLADLNAALQGMSYRETTGFTGDDQLNLLVSDLGATGSGGALTASASVPIYVGSSTFLQGRYLEVGVDQFGNLGSDGPAPAGFHSAGQLLGAESDPERDGWASYDGDFITPGYPLDEWGLQIGSSVYRNNSSLGYADLAGGSTATVDNGQAQTVRWAGGAGGVSVDQAFTLSRNDLSLGVVVTLTNTTGATLTDLYYYRHVDPDNNFDQNGLFATTNTVLRQGQTDGMAYVIATQPDGSQMGLLGEGTNARASWGRFGTINPVNAWLGTGGHGASGTSTADEGLTVVYRIPSLAAGQSITLNLRYVFAASGVPYLDLDADDSNSAGTGYSASFTEGSAPVAVTDVDASISDTDSLSLSSLIATITNLQDGAAERLAANTSGTAISASYSNGVLTLSGTDTVANYNQVLRSITYENTAQAPGTVARSITFAVSDGLSTSNLAAASVAVLGVNDAPVVNLPAGQTLAEDSTLVFSAANGNAITLGDVDVGSGLMRLTLTASSGTLSLGSAAGLSFLVGDGTADTVVSVEGSLADLNAALDGLQFSPVANADGSVTINVSLNDRGNTGTGGAAGVTRSLNLSVTPVNDEQQLVTNTGLTVPENATGGVITPAMLRTADIDNATAELIYTLTGPLSHGSLHLDGVLLAVGDSFSQLDIDSGLLTYSHDGSESGSDTLNFRVDDGAGAATTGVLAITITPVDDEPPVITSDGGGGTAALSIAENNASVTTVVASDADRPPSTLVFSIVGGADAALFSLDAATGSLRFAAAPDFERPTDADGDGVYELQVQVSDGLRADTQRLLVTVTAVNDNDPVITSDGGGATAVFSVRENSTSVTTVTATDADLPAATLTYRVAGGADAAWFAIDAATGALRFVSAPDREAPADANADNVYEVIVLADDGAGRTATQSLMIGVDNVDEPPVITALGLSVTEGGSVTLGASDLGVSDADSPPADLTWTVSTIRGGQFEIGAQPGIAVTSFTQQQVLSGEVRFVHDGSEVAPGFEAVVADRTGLSAPQTAVGRLTPVNDAPVIAGAGFRLPTITEDEVGNAGASVAEIWASAGPGAVTDAEDATGLGLVITGADAGNGRWQFSTDSGLTWSDLGLVSAAQGLHLGPADRIRLVPDGLNATSASLTVIAWDRSNGVASGARAAAGPGGGSDAYSLQSAQVLIAVTGVNDAPVAVGGDTVALDIDENTTRVTVVQGRDPDLPSQVLSYSIDGGEDAARFQIDSATGELSLRSAPNFEQPSDANADNRYVVRVRIDDGQGGSRTQTLTVRVNDANDAPQLVLPASADVMQRAANGTWVALAAAQDEDAGQVLSYSLVDDAGGRVRIDAQSGRITVAQGAALDYTVQRSWTVVVQVTDAGGATGRQSFELRVYGLPADTGSLPSASIPAASSASAAGPGVTSGPAPAPDTAVAAPAPAIAAPAPAAAKADVASPTDSAVPEDTRPGTVGGSAVRSASALGARVRLSADDAATGALAPSASGGTGRGVEIHVDLPSARSERAPMLSFMPMLPGQLPLQGAAVSLELTRTLLDLVQEGVSESAQGLGTLIGKGWSVAARSSGGDLSRAIEDVFSPNQPKNTPIEQLLIEVTQPQKVVSVSLTAGFVWWLTRGGGLLASMLMGVPAWRHMDLLPVMARADEEDDEDDDDGDRQRRDEADDGEDALEGLFDKGGAQARDTEDPAWAPDTLTPEASLSNR